MASVEKQTSAKNEYQNRKALMSDRSKGYGVERHTRVISLAENGRYISGRKNEDTAIKTGKSSVVTHVKRQAAEKFIGGKMQKAHYGESEPTVSATEANTDNAENKNTNHYVQNGEISKLDNQSSVQSQNAAELKKELERKIAVSRFNDKSSIPQNDVAKYLERKEKISDVWGEQAENKSKSRKYFSYKKSKIENKYRRRVYKIEKKLSKLASGKSNIDNFTTLRKLAILKQDIVRPIKNGNAIGVAAVPATIYLKKLLEKTRLGRLAVRGKEAGSRIMSATANATDTSQATALAAQKTAEEVVKGTVGTINRYITRENKKVSEKNKYMREIKKAERAQVKANKYLEKSRDKILAKEEEVISGKASEKLMKKVEKFNDKKNISKKQKRLEAKNRKLERKAKRQYNKRQKKNNSAVKNLKKKAKAKLMAVAGSILAAIVPIILIIVIVAFVANLVMYPFFYLTKKKDKVDDLGNEYVENEIEDSPVADTIQHYYEVMDEVVGDYNRDVIQTVLNSGGKYDNTGIVNPSEYAQWESDCQNWQAQTEAYQTWDYDLYVNEYGFDPPSISPPEENYWYSEEELLSMGQRRGPIFEGFRWDKDTDGTEVPTGKLYDEMLCTISTFNAKLMTRPETYTAANDDENTESEDTEANQPPETEENNKSENDSSSNGSSDIIFMTDETVKKAYGGAEFWEFSYWREDIECPSGGDCCTITVQVPTYDDYGNFTGYSSEEEKYCPGHFVIMMKLTLDFNLDKVWEKYQFDDEDKKNYKDTKKQFDKDKP